MLRIKGWNDVLFGVLLIACGTTGLFLISDLRRGTAMAMGPGYIPAALCWLNLGFGAVIGLRGLAIDGPPPTRWALRPLVAASAAIGFFMLVDRIGLMAGVIGVTLIAGLGDRETKWSQTLALALVLAVFAALAFVVGLGLPFPLWPVVKS